jgi:hypothetical protein
MLLALGLCTAPAGEAKAFFKKGCGHKHEGCCEAKPCDTCDACENPCEEKKCGGGLFGGLFKCKKHDCCEAEPCCEEKPACEPAPCDACENPCEEKKCGGGLFGGLFKCHKKHDCCEDSCDTCGGCNTCGANGSAAPAPAPEAAPAAPEPAPMGSPSASRVIRIYPTRTGMTRIGDR